MAEAEFNLTMNENLSSTAPRMVTATDSIVSAMERLSKSLTKVDNIDAKIPQVAPMAGVSPIPGKVGGVKSGGGLMGRYQNVMTGSGQAIEAGAAGSAGGVVSGLMTMIRTLGPLGVAAAAIIGATLVVADKAANVYEKLLPKLMESSAMIGEIGAKTGEASTKIRDVMSETSKMSSEWGYSINEGLSTRSGLARSGGDSSLGNMRSLMAIGREYGISPEQLSRSQGRAGRFGAGNILGLTHENLTGMGAKQGQFSEQVTAIESVFNEALGRGVIRPIEDVIKSLGFLSGMGEQYQGAEGASLASRISSSLSGSTGLQSSEDIIKFKASAAIGDPGESYIDTMKRLEGGMTPELVEEVFKQIKKYAGDNKDTQIHMLKNMFGLSYTNATDMMSQLGRDKYELPESDKRSPGESFVGTSEMTVLGFNETLKDLVRTKFGTGAFDIKAGLINKILTDEGEIDLTKLVFDAVEKTGHEVRISILEGTIESEIRHSNMIDRRLKRMKEGSDSFIKVMGNLERSTKRLNDAMIELAKIHGKDIEVMTE